MSSATITFRDPAGNVRPGSGTAYVGDSWLVTIEAPGGSTISEIEKTNGFGSDVPFQLFDIQQGYSKRGWGGVNYKYTENDTGQHVQTYFVNGVALPDIVFNVLPAGPVGLQMTASGGCQPSCNTGYVLQNGACVLPPAASPYVPSGSGMATPAAPAVPPAASSGLSATVFGIPVWALGLGAAAAFYLGSKK